MVAIKVLHAGSGSSQLGAQESQCLYKLNRADSHNVSGMVRLQVTRYQYYYRYHLKVIKL